MQAAAGGPVVLASRAALAEVLGWEASRTYKALGRWIEDGRVTVDDRRMEFPSPSSPEIRPEIARRLSTMRSLNVDVDDHRERNRKFRSTSPPEIPWTGI